MTSELRATCLQTGVGWSFETDVIFQNIHPEKVVLKVLIKIRSRRSSNEIQDLDGVRLGHSLYNKVKLGLAAFKTELRFGLNQPGFNFIRLKGKKFDTTVQAGQQRREWREHLPQKQFGLPLQQQDLQAWHKLTDKHCRATNPHLPM